MKNMARLVAQQNYIMNTGVFANVTNKRLVHSIAKSGQESTADETPVLVYDAPEFDAFNSAWE